MKIGLIINIIVGIVISIIGAIGWLVTKINTKNSKVFKWITLAGGVTLLTAAMYYIRTM